MRIQVATVPLLLAVIFHGHAATLTSGSESPGDSDRYHRGDYLRAKKSIWPFVKSSTEPSDVSNIEGTSSSSQFLEDGTVLRDDPELREQPFWKIHKYHGINFGRLKVPLNQDGGPGLQDLQNAGTMVGPSNPEQMEEGEVASSFNNGGSTFQGEISEPIQEGQLPARDLSFLDDLGGLAYFLPEPQQRIPEEASPEMVEEKSKETSLDTTEPSPGFFHSFFGKFKAHESSTAAPALVTTEAPSFFGSGFFGSIFGFGKKKENVADERKKDNPPKDFSIFRPKTRGSYLKVKVPAEHAAESGFLPSFGPPEVPVHQPPPPPPPPSSVPGHSGIPAIPTTSVNQQEPLRQDYGKQTYRQDSQTKDYETVQTAGENEGVAMETRLPKPAEPVDSATSTVGIKGAADYQVSQQSVDPVPGIRESDDIPKPNNVPKETPLDLPSNEPTDFPETVATAVPETPLFIVDVATQGYSQVASIPDETIVTVDPDLPIHEAIDFHSNPNIGVATGDLDFGSDEQLDESGHRAVDVEKQNHQENTTISDNSKVQEENVQRQKNSENVEQSHVNTRVSITEQTHLDKSKTVRTKEEISKVKLKSTHEIWSKEEKKGGLFADTVPDSFIVTIGGVDYRLTRLSENQSQKAEETSQKTRNDSKTHSEEAREESITDNAVSSKESDQSGSLVKSVTEEEEEQQTLTQQLLKENREDSTVIMHKEETEEAENQSSSSYEESKSSGANSQTLETEKRSEEVGAPISVEGEANESGLREQYEEERDAEVAHRTQGKAVSAVKEEEAIQSSHTKSANPVVPDAYTESIRGEDYLISGHIDIPRVNEYKDLSTGKITAAEISREANVKAPSHQEVHQKLPSDRPHEGLEAAAGALSAAGPLNEEIAPVRASSAEQVTRNEEIISKTETVIGASALNVTSEKTAGEASRVQETSSTPELGAKFEPDSTLDEKSLSVENERASIVHDLVLAAVAEKTEVQVGGNTSSEDKKVLYDKMAHGLYKPGKLAWQVHVDRQGSHDTKKLEDLNIGTRRQSVKGEQHNTQASSVGTEEEKLASVESKLEGKHVKVEDEAIDSSSKVISLSHKEETESSSEESSSRKRKEEKKKSTSSQRRGSHKTEEVEEEEELLISSRLHSASSRQNSSKTEETTEESISSITSGISGEVSSKAQEILKSQASSEKALSSKIEKSSISSFSSSSSSSSFNSSSQEKKNLSKTVRYNHSTPLGFSEYNLGTNKTGYEILYQPSLLQHLNKSLIDAGDRSSIVHEAEITGSGLENRSEDYVKSTNQSFDQGKSLGESGIHAESGGSVNSSLRKVDESAREDKMEFLANRKSLEEEGDRVIARKASQDNLQRGIYRGYSRVRQWRPIGTKSE